MAKSKVGVDLEIDDKGSLKETSRKAKQAGKDLEKGAKGAHSMDRRLKGAAQASSNSTKNFSKMSQGISGGLVPAYATLAASLFAVDAAFRALKRGSDLRVQQQGMTAYAQSTGLALKTMTKNLQAATDGQLDFKEAAESVAIAASAGFSGDQITQIGKAAKQASITLGRDFADSYQRLIKGITKAEPELLDELGIILRLDDAMAKHSRTINKSRQDFTAYERQTAVLNEVMRQVEEKFGAVGDAVPVNVMGQLGTKFTEISDSFLSGIAPIAEFFGGILVNNTSAAVAAMGVFAASILKQVIPSAELMKQKMIDAAAARKQAFGDLKGAPGQFMSGMRGAFSSATATGAASDIAKTDLKDVKSAGLKQLRSGKAMTGSQKGGLKRALKLAEGQYAKHNAVVTGMFKGKDAKTLRSLRLTLTAMDGGFKGFVAKTRLGMTQVVATFKLSTTAMKAIWKVTAGTMARTAAMMGRAMNKALGIIGWIGMLFMAKDTLIGMWESLDKILIKVGETITKVGNFIARFMPKVGKAIAEFGKKTTEKGKGMEDEYEGKRDARKRKNFIDMEAKRIADMRTEAEEISYRLTGPGKAASQLLGDLGGGSSVRGIKQLSGKGYSQEQIKKVTDEQIKHFTVLAKLDPAYEAVITSLQANEFDKAAKQADDITKGHANHTKALQDLKSTQDGFNKSIAEALLKSQKLGEFGIAVKQTVGQFAAMKDNQETVDKMKDTIENMFGAEAAAGVTTYAQAIEFMNTKFTAFLTNAQLVADAELALGMAQGAVAQATGGVSIAGGYASRGAKAATAGVAAAQARNVYDNRESVRIAELGETEEGSPARALVEAAQALELLKVENLEKTSERLKMLNTDMGELAMSATSAFVDGMQSGIEGLITGTKSLGDAFKDMAKNILASLAKVIAKQLMMRMLMGAFGGTSFGNFMGLDSAAPGGRYGGVMSSPGYRSYRAGAVASGPNSGYAATLHGTEAVVPLGNDRTIPVKLKGGAGSTNNTNVTVNMGSDGQADTTIGGETKGAVMGQLIAAAIEERLADEQRPGGILNRGGGG